MTPIDLKPTPEDIAEILKRYDKKDELMIQRELLLMLRSGEAVLTPDGIRRAPNDPD